MYSRTIFLKSYTLQAYACTSVSPPTCAFQCGVKVVILAPCPRRSLRSSAPCMQTTQCRNRTSPVATCLFTPRPTRCTARFPRWWTSSSPRTATSRCAATCMGSTTTCSTSSPSTASRPRTTHTCSTVGGEHVAVGLVSGPRDQYRDQQRGSGAQPLPVQRWVGNTWLGTKEGDWGEMGMGMRMGLRTGRSEKAGEKAGDGVKGAAGGMAWDGAARPSSVAYSESPLHQTGHLCCSASDCQATSWSAARSAARSTPLLPGVFDMQHAMCDVCR